MANVTPAPIDYSINNLANPIITNLSELPQREEIRPHRKMERLPKQPRIRRPVINDDSDGDNDNDGDDGGNVVRFMLPQIDAHAGAGALPNQDASPGILWRTIAKLQWRNKSDGAAPTNMAAGLIRSMSFDEKAQFTREYNEAIGAVIIVLTNIFATNGIIDAGVKLTIASHAVAMGREQYQTFMDDISLFEFLIACDECQSLDAAIRNLLG